MTGPPGPGHVTTGIRGLGMAKRTRDLAKWGTGGVTGGNGQVTRLAGLVVPRAQRQSGSPGCAGAPGVPHRRPGPGRGAAAAAGSLTLLSRAGAGISSQPAGSVDLARERGPECPPRRQTRPIKQEIAHNEHAEVRGHTGGRYDRKELPCLTQL